MPYDAITDLPDAVRSRYSDRCQEVFRKAFNNATDPERGGGAATEEAAFKVAHTAAGMCADAGKAEPLEPDEMADWFAGKRARRLLAIPFSGPIPHSRNAKGIDLDGEFFDADTDIKPDWFDERPVDWHHSQDPSGKMNGALIGKARDLRQDEDGWWVDLWLNAGEKRLSLIRSLSEKGAELFGSSYAYPNLIKRNAKTGHIDVWPYMMQTLSTSPQNTASVHRPAKAALDLFDQADIAVMPVLRDVLTELDAMRDPDADPTGEAAAKAGRELSGRNFERLARLVAALDESRTDLADLLEMVRAKYVKTDKKDKTE